MSLSTLNFPALYSFVRSFVLFVKAFLMWDYLCTHIILYVFRQLNNSSNVGRLVEIVYISCTSCRISKADDRL